MKLTDKQKKLLQRIHDHPTAVIKQVWSERLDRHLYHLTHPVEFIDGRVVWPLVKRGVLVTAGKGELELSDEARSLVRHSR